ncbi:MAG: hypothetical protein D9V45_02215 [Chloroflexi bacterium]|nr:hypothetical protein [Anaerolinea sp.]TDA67239.1 MAG: hypothetical protein D9V45_02215 [Chloroflexota bacterium]
MNVNNWLSSSAEHGDQHRSTRVQHLNPGGYGLAQLASPLRFVAMKSIFKQKTDARRLFFVECFGY